jgi:hypothetical protein
MDAEKKDKLKKLINWVRAHTDEHSDFLTEISKKFPIVIKRLEKTQWFQWGFLWMNSMG